MPENVLRYRAMFPKGTLHPVFVVVEKAKKVSPDLDHWVERWADDYHHVDINTDSGIIRVTDRHSGMTVKVYNNSSWLSVWYEYHSNGKYYKAYNLESVTKEEADAGKP